MPNEIENLRDRLCNALDERALRVKYAENWYGGLHPMPEPRPYTLASVDDQARAAFNNICSVGVMNITPPIVDAVAAKAVITSIRFGESSIGSDPAAMRIWQRNQMDADHRLSIKEALKVGSAPVIVWYDEDNKALSSITIEDPAQVIIAYRAGSRRKRAAALKRWTDDDGYSLTTLYTPDWIYKWRSKSATSTITVAGAGAGAWDERGANNEPWPLPNPLGIVPVFELRANATTKAATYGGGLPEFTPILTDQVRINEHMFHMLTTEQAQSFRQRWATDWDYPTNPDGTPDRDRMAKFAASGFVTLNSAEDGPPVSVGEFAQADFRPFVDIIDMEYKHVAMVTATPPDAFLIGDMINVAAEALAGVKGRFVSKVEDHEDQFGETWEEILRCALQVENDPRHKDYSLSVGWKVPEDWTPIEQATVARTKFDLGAPQEAVFASLPDVDQIEARRWIVEAAAEQLLTDRSTTQTVPVAEPMQRNKDAAKV